MAARSACTVAGMSINRRIREARERLAISQAELARRVGVSTQAVQQWEDENPEVQTSPRPKIRGKVAEALGVHLAWLEYGEDYPRYDPAAAVPLHVSTPPGQYDSDEINSLIVNEPKDFPLKSGGIELDKLDVRASMGSGIPLLERETVIDSIRVPMDWVHEHFPHITAAKNLKIITGFGDSMLPTYKHGDPLIVDTGVNAMDVDTVYVFAYQDELYIKRIQRLPDKSIKVISDNRALYEPFTLDAKQRQDVHVIARVICAVNMNKIG